MQTLSLPTVGQKHDLYHRLLECRANIRGIASPNDLPVGEMLVALDASGRAWNAANDRAWTEHLSRYTVTVN
jgi:hypothetical protein